MDEHKVHYHNLQVYDECDKQKMRVFNERNK